MTTDSLARLQCFDTNTISDALDFLGLPGATYGLRPLWDCPKIVGRASTIAVGPKSDSAPTVHMLTPVIASITSHDRILVVGGGSEGVSCWGDIVANAAKVQGIRGTVIDGMCRDIEGSEGIRYPVYGLGVTMISARNRLVQLSAGETLSIRGVNVSEDDYVIADRCGAVFIPAESITEVLDLAGRIVKREDGMVAAIRSGISVEAVMHDSHFDAARNDNSEAAEAQAENLAELFKGLDTPGVSDAMDKLGLHGQALGIMPLLRSQQSVVGPAFTVHYVPASSPPGSVGDFIDDVAEGEIIVIDNSGRTDCTVWGDIMTQYAGIKRIAGTVIDGVCRDVDRVELDRYPLFSRGKFMRTGKDRVEVGAVNVPVSIGTVRVCPKDLVVADANGVVIVPRDRAREVAETARAIEAVETQIRDLIASGVTLREARERLRYHTLQRKS